MTCATADETRFSAGALRRPRVLIADDDPVTLETYAIFLREAGYTASTAESGRRCVSLLHDQYFDLLLLDMRFGNVDGLALLRRLRRAGIAIPIVVVTGFGDVETAVTAMKYGATDFVGKCMDEEKLLAVVQNNLADSLEHAHVGPVSRPPLWLHAGDERARLLDFVARAYGQLGSPSFEPAAIQRSRIAARLARACGDDRTPLSDFVGCAEALRRLTSAGSCPLKLVISEVRQALEQDIWQCPNVSDARTLQVISALAKGGQALAWSETEWGRYLRLHRTQVGRIIYAQTGKRFRVWRRTYRLKRAAALLAAGNEQVAQIAFAVGFQYTQTSQFTREFHEFFGATPLEFRRLAMLMFKSDSSTSH